MVECRCIHIRSKIAHRIAESKGVISPTAQYGVLQPWDLGVAGIEFSESELWTASSGLRDTQSLSDLANIRAGSGLDGSVLSDSHRGPAVRHAPADGEPVAGTSLGP